MLETHRNPWLWGVWPWRRKWFLSSAVKTCCAVSKDGKFYLAPVTVSWYPEMYEKETVLEQPTLTLMHAGQPWFCVPALQCHEFPHPPLQHYFITCWFRKVKWKEINPTNGKDQQDTDCFWGGALLYSVTSKLKMSLMSAANPVRLSLLSTSPHTDQRLQTWSHHPILFLYGEQKAICWDLFVSLHGPKGWIVKSHCLWVRTLLLSKCL